MANGYEALYNNTTGGFNAANGVFALYNNTIGNFNTATGAGALLANTTGSNNVAIGTTAGIALTTGSGNVCIGAGVTVSPVKATPRAFAMFTLRSPMAAQFTSMPTTRSAHFPLRAGSNMTSSRWTTAAKLSLRSNRSPSVTRKTPILRRRSPLV